MAYSDLQKLFATHVLEVQAVRRIPKIGKGHIRGFLCTNSWPLLNSIPGKAALHFKARTKPPPYNAESKALITTWDILMQNWRNINLRDYVILDGMPVRNEQEIAIFWAYFEAVLKKMSTGSKMAFMDRGTLQKFNIQGIKKG